MTSSHTSAKPNWKGYEKIALRGFFIYAAITFIPFVPSFYQQDFDAGFTVNSYPFRWLDVLSQNNPWFFLLIRYQIALRMSWFAIAKVFPVQMPFPTLSQLNTNLGDFTPGKLYWLTTGVSPFFEVFAGVFELSATVFILFRRTTTLGALMMV